MRSCTRRCHRGGLAAVVLLALLAWHAEATAAQLTLTWANNNVDPVWFSVERSTGGPGAYAPLATTGTGVTTYADATVVAGTTYCYRVRASDTAGDSGYSNEACGAVAAGFVVTVATTGTGTGTVVSSPAGITCPGTCVQSFTTGTVLTLTATPAPGSSFSGWSGGGCVGTAPCILTGNVPVTVTATFTPCPHPRDWRRGAPCRVGRRSR